MRIVKEADVRRNEILDAAGILFMEKGYDDTSVADIMNAVHIAKGTLYHHFKSKEEIMNALVERQTAHVLLAAKGIAADKSIPVKERLALAIRALHVDTERPEDQKMMERLHTPQNIRMHQKTKKVVLQSVPPIMSAIIEDGVTQGIFETLHPLECMEMALCYLDVMLDDDIFELTDEKRLNKIRAFIYQLERLLGVEKGELASFEEAFVRRRDEI